jgi:hypothetical protein
MGASAPIILIFRNECLVSILWKYFIEEVMDMKKTFLIFALLVLIPSLLSAGEYESKGKAGDYTMVVRIDKNPPGMGNNAMNIYITDKNQRAVTDAHVKVRYLMPSLPGKPPMMEYDTEATLRDNHYLAHMNLSMAGKWSVIVSVIRAGKTGTMTFSFFVK